jgi:hypothetical protein
METEKKLLKILLSKKEITPMELPKSLLLSYRQNINKLRSQGINIICRKTISKRTKKKISYYSIPKNGLLWAKKYSLLNK